MLFDKFLSAARRSHEGRDERLTARPEMPTIVVQPAQPIIQPAQPIIQILRPGWWERLLPLAVSLASVVVAIGALVIADRSYHDQLATDIRAASASNAQYAEHVSSWIKPSSGHLPVRVIVQNLGSAPIADT